MQKIAKEYEKRGWQSISTGGGCTAFSFDLARTGNEPAQPPDPQTPQGKLFPAASHLLCTDVGGLQMPTEETQAIMIGLYDEDDQYVELGEGRKSVMEQWTGMKLTTNFLFAHHDEIIEYFRAAFRDKRERRTESAERRNNGNKE
jgi:hypothetical protein